MPDKIVLVVLAVLVRLRYSNLCRFLAFLYRLYSKYAARKISRKTKEPIREKNTMLKIYRPVLSLQLKNSVILGKFQSSWRVVRLSIHRTNNHSLDDLSSSAPQKGDQKRAFKHPWITIFSCELCPAACLQTSFSSSLFWFLQTSVSSRQPSS